MKKFIEQLNIDFKAIGLIKMIEFLFLSQEDLDNLVNDCKGMSTKEINKYVYNCRKKKCMEDYTLKEFLVDYENNRNEALSKLFNEPLNGLWIKKLKMNDPKLIYIIHNVKRKDIFFMEFLLEV